MKKHTQVYMQFFGYGMDDFIPCENMDGRRAVDIHHISPRGMGGSTKKDNIINLIGLCRECHDIAEDDRDPRLKEDECFEIHLNFISRHLRMIGKT